MKPLLGPARTENARIPHFALGTLPIIVLIAIQACAERAPQSACESCAIRLEHTVTLGSHDGPGAFPSIPSAAAVDSRGRYYVVAAEMTDEAPFVFDHDGRYLQRLGREGSGPTEFRRPSELIVTTGDTIHIVDGALGRLTVLTPSYDIARTMNGVPYTYDLVRLPDGSYVITNAGASSLFALERIGTEGTSLNVFDEEPRSIRRDQSWRNARRLAPARQGGVWSVTAFFRLVVTRWASDGSKQDEFDIVSPWFAAYDSLSNPTSRQPPFAAVHGLWENDDGYLWIVGHTAAQNWAEGLGQARRAEGRWYYPIDDYGKVYDSVIEVRDARSGALLAERRVSGSMGRLMVIAPGVLGARRETADGWWLIDVWEVRLVRPPASNPDSR